MPPPKAASPLLIASPEIATILSEPISKTRLECVFSTDNLSAPGPLIVRFFVHRQLATAEFDGAKNAPGVDDVAVVGIRYRLTQGAMAAIVGIYNGDGICMRARCGEPPQTAGEQNPGPFHGRRVFSKFH